MPRINQPLTLGDWLVKPGKEPEFIALWESFARWTSRNHAGGGAGHLLQDPTEPTRFVSFGFWENTDTIDRWREDSEFLAFLAAARKLCDDIQPRTLRLVSLVSDEE